MTPEQKDRYSRQIRLPYMGEKGQQTLLDARVLVIGAGGLGSPVLLYLAAAGVGHLVISDFDVVESSNLQRQIVHSEHSVGSLKVDSARQAIQALNAGIQVTPLAFELEGEALAEQVALADVVVDCTDNFPSRFQLNELTYASKTPYVSAAAVRREGQLTTFDSRQDSSPCYRCLYPDTAVEGVTCALEGVLAPVVGIVGTMQAQEVLNVLLGVSALTGALMLFDGSTMEWHRMVLPKKPGCPVCGQV
ncbi:unnamed protein product [Cyprideis torosa]|uniref:THIF-type NAD/FAD binding fold domain-containing protein n=1 Tax=Cyprideis torosa TaxID=163714 RepID=A0A7R8ZXT6_9CRUS|nr:unnamed protein product [Cyprideis torosa]CAG0907604.1 unnamed protein product [Cyprideis torosa]